MTSLKRNVITPLLPILKELGFECTEKVSKNLIEISFDGKANSFYLFGGKDESSASLIQGMTLGGVLLDEVALMPRSFVEQALARCSVEGSKFWFNCNPDNPLHWFHEEWIKKSEEKNCLYLHFLMQDNSSLTRQIMAIAAASDTKIKADATNGKLVTVLEVDTAALTAGILL